MEPKTDGDLHGPPQAQPYLATPRQPSWSLPSSEHQHGWLASPCSLLLPSLPSQYASMALAKLSEEERLLQRYPSPRRCGLLSFTLLGEATAGQKKKPNTLHTEATVSKSDSQFSRWLCCPPGDTLKTTYLLIF